MNKKRVLLILPERAAGTGSGTYSGILSNALGQVGEMEVRLYSSVSDLSQPWDIVHVLDIKRFDPRLALAVIKAPLVVDIHDVYWMRGEQHFPTPDLPLRLFLAAWRRRRYGAILRRANAVIVHSNYVASKVSHSNVQVVPYAIETLEPGPPLSDRPPRVVFAGRDYFRKGLPVLMKAWRKISSSRPTAELIIAGREFAHGKIYARMCSLKSMVRWMGDLARDALLDEIKNARAFVLPSWTEAFGIVLIEAAALGTPVVATRAGGIPEALGDGSAGILIDKGDSVALAKSILRCLDPEPDAELLEMSERARKAATGYSVENLVNSVLQVYRGCR